MNWYGVALIIIGLIMVVSPSALSLTQVTSCGILNQTGETYVLQNDVTAASSCFLVAADNIVLDLNWHKITYGTNPGTNTNCLTYFGSQSGNVCHHGVIGGGYTQVTGDFPGTWTDADTVTVKNGAITQSPNAGLFSDAIKTYAGDAWHVYNVTIFLNITDAMGVYAKYGYVDNWHVHHNSITAEVEDPVTNRHEGLSGIRVGQGADIHHNTIKGVPLAGIGVIEGHGSQIYNNHISTEQWGDNSFGIFQYAADNVIIHDNVINSTNGRGIIIDSGSDNNTIYNNYVEVQQTVCHPGIEFCASGTYGFKFRGGSSNNHVYNNTIIGNAKNGNRATAFVTTATVANTNNLIENNTIIATSDGTVVEGSSGLEGTANALAMEVNPGSPTNDIFRNNRIISDRTVVRFYGNNRASSNNVLENSILEKGPNPGADFTPLKFHYYDTGSVNNKLYDTSFVGTSYNDVSFSACVGHGVTCEFRAYWTLTVDVRNQLAQPIQGASVEIRDVGNNLAFSGTTDSSGKFVRQPEEFHNNNGVKTFKAPYTVTVTYLGNPQVRSVPLTAKTTEVFTFSTGGTVGNITLLSPPDAQTYAYTVSAINFVFRPISPSSSQFSCSLFFNDAVVSTLPTVFNNTDTTFGMTGIANGASYAWRVECASGSLVSSTRTFTINATPPQCTGGQTRACTTGQSCPGTEACAGTVWSGVCQDVPADGCPAACTNGQNQSCTTTDSCPGTQICSGGNWGTCADVPADSCPVVACTIPENAAPCDCVSNSELSAIASTWFAGGISMQTLASHLVIWLGSSSNCQPSGWVLSDTESFDFSGSLVQ